MSQEHIALFMFASMMLMLLSGQRGIRGHWCHRRHCCPCSVGNRRAGYPFFSRDEANEMVSAAYAPDVYFHGLRPVRKQAC